MNDTPQHIYDLQLKLWLTKSPMERLNQLMLDNDAMYKFWREVKPAKNYRKKTLIIKTTNKINCQ